MDSPHIPGKGFVDDAGLGLLGAPEGQVQRVQQPGQKMDGITLKRFRFKLRKRPLIDTTGCGGIHP